MKNTIAILILCASIIVFIAIAQPDAEAIEQCVSNSNLTAAACRVELGR